MFPATKLIRIGCKLDQHVYCISTVTVKKRSREAGNKRGKRASCKERVALTGSKSGSLKGAGLCPRKNSSGVWNLRPMLRANCTQRKKKKKPISNKLQLQFNLLNVKSADWWKHTFKFKSNLPKHIMLFPDSLVFAGAEELHTQFHASRVKTGQKAWKYCAVSITGCILYTIPRQSRVCCYWKAPHTVSSIYCGNTARMLNIFLQQASYSVFCKLFPHSLVFYFFFFCQAWNVPAIRQSKASCHCQHGTLLARWRQNLPSSKYHCEFTICEFASPLWRT